MLLRIILELFEKTGPEYVLYEQGKDDPYVQADAVLTIGDLALKMQGKLLRVMETNRVTPIGANAEQPATADTESGRS